MSIGETLKSEVKARGWTILETSRRADVPYSLAHGFLVTGRDIRLSAVEKLADVLGLELGPVKPAKPRRKGR